MSSWLARNGAVYVIATANPYFADLDLASGSAVIDPHGMMPSRPGVTPDHVATHVSRRFKLAPAARRPAAAGGGR